MIICPETTCYTHTTYTYTYTYTYWTEYDVAYTRENPDKVSCINIAFTITINPCEIISFTSDFSLSVFEQYIIYQDFVSTPI